MVTNLTISIPDAKAARVIHALCAASGIPPANETPARAKAALIEHITRTVQQVEYSEQLAALTPPTDPALNLT